jgi:hypothetical protein
MPFLAFDFPALCSALRNLPESTTAPRWPASCIIAIEPLKGYDNKITLLEASGRMVDYTGLRM